MATAISNSIFDKYSLANQKQEEKSANDVNQTDFLKLLTAQMKNQDPSKPADSGEFMSQMAQFTQVSSLEKLQKSFDNFSTEMLSTQTLQATSLLGKSVMVPGGSVDLSEGKNVKASLDMGAPATDVVINITDASGALVDRLNLGSVDSGIHDFSWDGRTTTGGQAAPGTYYITAEGTSTTGQNTALNTLIQNKVSSVSIANNSVILNTENGKELRLSDVQQIM